MQGDYVKKIIIYGNCHTGLIIEYLKACVDFNDKYEILEIPQIQEIYNSNNMNLDTIPFSAWSCWDGRGEPCYCKGYWARQRQPITCHCK